MTAKMMVTFLLMCAAEGARVTDVVDLEGALEAQRAASEAADVALSLIDDPTEGNIKDAYGACPEDNAVCVAIRFRPPLDSSDCSTNCGQLAGRLTTTLGPGEDPAFPKGCGRCVEMDEGEPGEDPHRRWPYDLIFPHDEETGATAPNEDVYLGVVKPTMSKAFACSDPALSCQSAAFFAYGATGSGKSFTMGFEKKSKGGLMQRGVEQMFAELQGLKEQGHPLGNQDVYMAFYELYGDSAAGAQVYDLLGPGKTKPKTGIKGTREKVLSSAIHFKKVTSLQDMMNVFGKANEKRAVGGTGMNAVSSRSHAAVIFYITDKKIDKLYEKVQAKEVPQGKLLKVLNDAVQIMFVDLAGSEPAGKWDDPKRVEEGKNINKGLSKLRSCISALADPKAKPCFTRDEMLVEMLKGLFDKDTKTGRAKAYTRMIATFNPSADPEQIKLSKGTMTYASQVKSIKIETPKGKKADNLVKIMPEQVIGQLKVRIAELEAELEKCGPSSAENGTGVAGTEGCESVDWTWQAELMATKEELEAEVEKLTEMNSGLTAQSEDASKRHAAEVAALTDKNERLAADKEQLEEEVAQSAALKAQIQDLQVQVASLKAENEKIAQLATENTKCQADKDELANKVTLLEQSGATAAGASDAALNDVQAKLNDARTSEAQCEEKLRQEKESSLAAHGELSKVQSKVDVVQKQKEAVLELLQSERKLLAGAKEQASSAQQSYDQCTRDYSVEKATANACTSQKEKQQIELQAARTELGEKEQEVKAAKSLAQKECADRVEEAEELAKRMSGEKEQMEFMIVGVQGQLDGCVEEAVSCAQEISESESAFSAASTQLSECQALLNEAQATAQSAYMAAQTEEQQEATKEEACGLFKVADQALQKWNTLDSIDHDLEELQLLNHKQQQREELLEDLRKLKAENGHTMFNAWLGDRLAELLTDGSKLGLVQRRLLKLDKAIEMIEAEIESGKALGQEYVAKSAAGFRQYSAYLEGKYPEDSTNPVAQRLDLLLKSQVKLIASITGDLPNFLNPAAKVAGLDKQVSDGYCSTLPFFLDQAGGEEACVVEDAFFYSVCDDKKMLN